MFTKRLFVATVFVALSVGGCSDDSYPAEVKSEFMRACTVVGVSTKQCDCLWKAIDDNLPQDDLARFEATAITTWELGDEWTATVENCRSK